MTNVWVLLDWIGRIGASLMFIDKGIGYLGNRVALTAYAQSKHAPHTHRRQSFVAPRARETRGVTRG